MAKIEISPLEEYIAQLKKLEKDKMVPVIEASIYEGAGIIADAIYMEIDELKIDKSLKNGISEENKNDLKKGFGIAPFQSDGNERNVKIGFAGYGDFPTKKYPKGLPVPMLARSIVSGTSFRKKDPFVRRAVNKVKKQAIERMDEVIEEKLKKEME